MNKVKLSNLHIYYKDEISIMYETGEIFEIEIDSNYNRVEKTTIEIINLLIKNPKFNEINALITKQYKIAEFFFEVMYHLEALYDYSDQGKSFELSLKSEILNGIYVRANFTAKEIKRLSYFRTEYDEKDIMALGPDFNYDIRVIRRASIDLLYKKLYSGNAYYRDLNLSSIHLWDYKFGLS